MKRIWNAGVAAVAVSGLACASSPTETPSITQPLSNQCYVVTDLGTLLAGAPMDANGVNDRGQVVGRTGGSSSARHGFLWANGEMTDLGAGTSAYAINNGGEVVGQLRVKTGPSAGQLHAAVWMSNVPIDLGTLPGDNFSIATAVNDQGGVIGLSGSSSGNFFKVFLWKNGVMMDLGLPSMLLGANLAINAGGQVAESTADNHAVRWAQGVTTDLGSLGFDGEAGIAAINDGGQIAGGSAGHAFLWMHGVMNDLGTLPGGFGDSEAIALNNLGQVVGAASTTADNDVIVYRAFLWNNGVMRDLGTLGGGNSFAYAINNRGQVVGSADTSDGGSAPFLWDNGQMIKLDGPDGAYARFINAQSLVVGSTGPGIRTPLVWRPGPCGKP